MTLASRLFLASMIIMSYTSLAADALSPQQRRNAAIQLSKTFETGDVRGLSVVNPDKYTALALAGRRVSVS